MKMVAAALPKRQNPPTEQDSMTARASVQTLSRYTRKDQSLRLCVVDVDDDAVIVLPPAAVDLLMLILKTMTAGQALTLIPQHAELTTVQAAEVLNVSRPFLIKLLDEGKIPYRKVGRHRRVLMEDVMTYKEAIDQRREAILDQLVADAQEQGGMGYD